MQFLLAYGRLFEDHNVLRHVELTLDNIALGGIYDQIGGGWYRYSVDALWKIPHFEKMLYDNAQLIGIYARAFQHTKKNRLPKGCATNNRMAKTRNARPKRCIFRSIGCRQ